MSALGLSEAQLAERRTRLHAGDAASIMAGDYRSPYRRIKFDEHNDLYDDLPWFIQKRLTRADLAFKAALGNYLEPFNLYWTMKQTGRPITYFSANPMMQDVWMHLTQSPEGGKSTPVLKELVISKRYKFMACNLDGMTTTPQGYRAVIDAKPRMKEVDLLLYTPAMVWQATCAGTDWWGLAGLVVGNKWEEPVFQEVDPMYQAEMIQRATECWGYIERDEEPPEAEAAPVLPPKPQPKRRTIDVPINPDDPVFGALMQRENWLSEMVEAMGAFATTHAAAVRHVIARKRIADVLPEDVGRVTRGRIKATRDGRGVTISLEKEPSDAEDRG